MRGSIIGAVSTGSFWRQSSAAWRLCGVALSSRMMISSSGRSAGTAGEPESSSSSKARRSPPLSRTINGRIASTMSGEKNPEALKLRQRSTRRKKGSSASRLRRASRSRCREQTVRRDGSPFDRTAYGSTLMAASWTSWLPKAAIQPSNPRRSSRVASLGAIRLRHCFTVKVLVGSSIRWTSARAAQCSATMRWTGSCRSAPAAGRKRRVSRIAGSR